MNINDIDNFCKFSDVLRSHELISKLFKGWKDLNENDLIKKSDLLTLWAYKETRSNFFTIKNKNYLFDQIKIDNYHVDTKIYDKNMSMIYMSVNKSYQILIGFYKGNYFFIDPNEHLLFCVNRSYLNDYLDMFVKMNLTLFDDSLIEYKQKLINIQEKNLNLFKLKNI